MAGLCCARIVAGATELQAIAPFAGAGPHVIYWWRRRQPPSREGRKHGHRPRRPECVISRSACPALPGPPPAGVPCFVRAERRASFSQSPAAVGALVMGLLL